MKKFLMMAAVALMAATGALAQRIQVVDSEGNPVSYASVLNPKAEYIGITDLEGVVPDLKGAKDITVTHVAFKTKTVKVSGKDLVVTLEDADFNMPEITVQPKPFIYVQTYSRLYIYNSKEGIMYYRAGLTDNTYDTAKKTVAGKTAAVSKAKKAILKTLFGMLSPVLNQHCQIQPKTFEERMQKHAKECQVKFTEVAPDRQTITDFKGTIGSVIDDMSDHQRRYSCNFSELYMHELEAKGKDKEVKRINKATEKVSNSEDADYFLYHIDDNGHYGPEDFIMSQYMSSWDREEDGKNVHWILALQVYSTDRAYVTKDELKQRQKANKMKMNYANVRQFERDHSIPALVPAVQSKLNELWKSE